MKYAAVVERSGNSKLSATGNVSASSVAQQSCWEGCPFKGTICYAEKGTQNYTTSRLNREAKTRKKSLAATRTFLSNVEAAGIRALTGLRKFRGRVVGDSSTPESATIVGLAMNEHEAKHGKAAWTYTHSWPIIKLAAWAGARVLASCNNVGEIAKARARGYATTVLVPKHPTNKIYVLGGEKIIPCPAQFDHKGKKFLVTCEFCTICQRPDWLRENKLTVGFQPEHDGKAANKMLKMLEAR